MYGFKSENTPPQHEGLAAFEEELYGVIKSIKFKQTSNTFQSRLANDTKKIRDSPVMLIPADKTTNLYEVSVDNYSKLLKDNITIAYQKADISALSKINTEAQSIANELKLDARVKSFSKHNAFITLKDHKANFQNHPKCRLINPAKSEIGKVSKQHLDSINTEIRKKSGLNQWKNTASTLSWFNNIPSKADGKFLKFDKLDFYSSISEKLLLMRLNTLTNL